MTDEVWAGVRDASWYDRPRVRGRIIVHITVGTSHRSLTAACNERAALRPYGPARTVPTILRCRRRACARRWPHENPTETPR